MIKRFVTLAALVLAAAVGTGAPPAEASFHIVTFDEIFPGTTEFPDAQFVEIELLANGQGQFANKPINLYAADGAFLGPFATFPRAGTSGAKGARFVACTPSAALNFRLPCDAIAMRTLPAGGGKLQFASTSDVVTFGAYTGTANPQPKTHAGDLQLGTSAERIGTSWTSAGGFVYGSWTTASPTPTNNLGLRGI